MDSLIDEWIKENDINISEYRIWTNKDAVEDYQRYSTLEEFLNNNLVADSLLNIIETDSKNWIRIGKVFLNMMF